jgi:hypothetical protein
MATVSTTVSSPARRHPAGLRRAIEALHGADPPRHLHASGGQDEDHQAGMPLGKLTPAVVQRWVGSMPLATTAC